MLYMVSNIFIIPFWSASTEAYHKKDLQWIKNGIKRYNQLNLLLVLVSLFMLIFSAPFYRFWLGEGKVTIPAILTFWGFLYYNVMMFGGKYVQFLNGIGPLRIQFIASILSPLVYIFVVMLLIKQFHLGVFSIFIGSIIANVNGYLIAPLQYHLVINKNRKGIWIK
jgi:O-antigen/teichoic acid export membrane protein